MPFKASGTPDKLLLFPAPVAAQGVTLMVGAVGSATSSAVLTSVRVMVPPAPSDTVVLTSTL